MMCANGQTIYQGWVHQGRANGAISPLNARKQIYAQ